VLTFCGAEELSACTAVHVDLYQNPAVLWLETKATKIVYDGNDGMTLLVRKKKENRSISEDTLTASVREGGRCSIGNIQTQSVNVYFSTHRDDRWWTLFDVTRHR